MIINEKSQYVYGFLYKFIHAYVIIILSILVFLKKIIVSFTKFVYKVKFY